MDFDGTISDARTLAIDSLARTLDEFGYQYNHKKMERLMGEKMHLILEGLGIHNSHIQTFRKVFYKRFVLGAKQGKISPCVPLEPLRKLSKTVPLVIVSNSNTQFLRASIRTLGLQGVFKGVFGSEKFATKDGMLVRLFKKYKIKPHEAVYVGDRFSDIEFARAAGCYAIAINNKCAWSTLTTIKKEKPDYIIKNFTELKKVVRAIN